MKRNIFSLAMVLALLLIMVVPLAGASAPNRPEYDDPTFVSKVDHRMDPLTKKQDALRLKDGRPSSTARPRAASPTKWKMMSMSNWSARAKTRSGPCWANSPTIPTTASPSRIATVDNTTIWIQDFNRDYYLDMLFAEGDGVNSMRQYYIEQSSNRYAVYGDVTDWVFIAG